jgi:deoxyribodipyrimidine photolyase
MRHVLNSSTQSFSFPPALFCMQGLRLHDNPALIEVASSSTLYPVFCLDPWFIASGNVGANRLNFLLQSLKNLHENLQKCNSRLIVLHGDPKEAIPAVVKALGAQALCFEKDTEPYAISRDAAVTVAVKELDCEVCSIPMCCTCFISLVRNFN